MKKKFICTVCGYIHEGEEAPEQCPICKAPASKFKEMTEDDVTEFATVHELGTAYKDKVSEELIEHCKMTFAGECSEVGMYLAMARQADREGYPEVARAFEHYAYEEANHASRYAELLGDVLKDTKSNLMARIEPRRVHVPRSSRWQNLPRRKALTLSTTPSTRWLRTRLATVQASLVFTTATSSKRIKTLTE